MRNQLVLLDHTGSEWRLDERTKELGRKGVAAARAALEQAGRNAVDQASRTPAA
jgi:hypothetical protein